MPPRRSSGNKRPHATITKQATPVLPRIRYFDKDAISEHLYCSICQDVYNYPTALHCGHVFCQNCIAQWFRASQSTCPECRERGSLANSHKGTLFVNCTNIYVDLIAHKFLDSVPVYCSFLGCTWLGRMDALQSHLSECDCNPAKLPDWMVTKGARKNSSGETEKDKGTTSLRMRLFTSGKADLMGAAASGDYNIFSMPSSSSGEPTIQSMADLTKDLVSSSDVIARNMQAELIDLSDDSE